MGKRIFLLVLLVGFVFVATATIAMAQEKPTQILSVNPLGLAFGILDVEYQKNISDSAAWAVRGNYWSTGVGSWKWSAIGAGGSYRGFFSPNAPAGGYWGVGVDALSLSAEYKYSTKTETASSFFFGPAGELGYRWLFEKFSVNAGAKVMYLLGSIEIANTKIPISGIVPGGVLSLGYAW